MTARLSLTTPGGWFRARRVAFSVMVSLAVAGLLRPMLHVEPGAEAVIAVEPPWYLDPSSLEAGPVDLPQAMRSLPAHGVSAYLAMPPIRPAEAELVAAVLGEVAPALPPSQAPRPAGFPKGARAPQSRQ